MSSYLFIPNEVIDIGQTPLTIIYISSNCSNQDISHFAVNILPAITRKEGLLNSKELDNYCIEPSYGGAPAIPMAHASLVIEVGVSTEQHICGELGNPSFYICPPSKLFDRRVAFHL